MTTSTQDILFASLRDVPDFPKPGILFKDITPLLADPALFELAMNELQNLVTDLQIDKIVGIEARGFIFGAVLASKMGIGFVPCRKVGKLPAKTRQLAYALEYGQAVIEMHEDSLTPGENVLLVDDVLATGGTAAAASRLITDLGGNVAAALFFLELGFLNGRALLGEVPVRSLLVS